MCFYCEEGLQAICPRHADEPMEVYLREGDEPTPEQQGIEAQERWLREQGAGVFTGTRQW